VLPKWLHKTKRKPLFEAVEKMKAKLMILGFISLMLSATSSSISNICIESKYYDTKFSPCKRSAAEESDSDVSHESRSHGHKLLKFFLSVLSRRVLSGAIGNTCKEGYEPFVSVEGLEQLQRFIFVMAIMHVFYSCLNMLLAIVKVCI
jgi:mlo protein